VNATEHEQFVEKLVRDIFDCLDTTQSEEEGVVSQREAAEGGLLRLSPEELESQLEDAVGVLGCYRNAAEAMNLCLLVCLCDAENRARLAHRGAKLAAGQELDDLD
jgi:hypothetical protein